MESFQSWPSGASDNIPPAMVTVQDVLDSSVNRADDVQAEYQRDDILISLIGALIWVDGPVSRNFCSTIEERRLSSVVAEEVMATLNWTMMAEDMVERIKGDTQRTILVVCNSWQNPNGTKRGDGSLLKSGLNEYIQHFHNACMRGLGALRDRKSVV